MRKLGIGAVAVLAAALFVAPGVANAATFTVTNTGDTNGPACVAGDPDCSLREALNAANSNGADDVINFDASVTGTINLDAQFGDLDIHNEGLDIQGPGAANLTISGGNHDRVFKLFGFDAPGEQVTISGLTMTGNSTGSGCCGNSDGGAILSGDLGLTDGGVDDFGNVADLTVANSVIRQSNAARGGAIATALADSASSGGLTVSHTTISGNTAEVGGGIYWSQVGRPVTVTHSTLSGNNANAIVSSSPEAPGFVEDGDGGALAIDTGTAAVVVENSTLAGNRADSAGGGIRFVSNGGDPRAVRNSTIAGNSAREGGGISVSSGDQGSARGVPPAPQVGLSSAIVGDNTADALGGDADGPDLRSDGASYNAGFSLLEVTNGATVTAAPPGSNITGQDPDLGGLAANGGPTQTKLPATSSPAIDAGVANSLATDQRGLARTVDRPEANPSGSDATDMGAVELAPDPDEPPPGPPKPQRCLREELVVKRGGNESEKIEGTPQRDGVFAHGGNDEVFGLQDRDCLFGGPGADEVDGGPDDDHVAGDPDDDTVRGNGGNDDVRGQHGEDRVFGGPGGDKRVTGGAGNDRVFGGDGNDVLIKGDRGNDKLDLGDGHDFVHAGGGTDTVLAVDGQLDTIVCGAGRHDIAFVDPVDAVNRDCEIVYGDD